MLQQEGIDCNMTLLFSFAQVRAPWMQAPSQLIVLLPAALLGFWLRVMGLPPPPTTSF
jgi:transaldolase